ncbi:MAG: relaxase/mobilization nuclease domain-containing protein [Lachnospiraceae bacterium]|nr:relaxase/mobilization nuclease domain-containing protein [Lachnospiraceae bacterium]
MATTRLIPMHKIKNQSVAYTVQERIGYAGNPDKTLGAELVTAYGCDPATAANEMLLTKRAYADYTGRGIPQNDVLLYQIRQSFKPGEITPEQAQKIGYDLAMSWTKGKHQFIVATHIDHAHIHNHIIYNSTCMDGKHKYRNFIGSSFALRRASDRLCLENGLSVVENPKTGRTHYGKWLGDKKAPSFQDKLRLAIDAALAEKPKDYEAFLALMKEAGYEYKAGKQPAFKGPGQKKFTRLRSLKEGYSEGDILAVIKGEKPLSPERKKAKNAQPQRVSLLVDIQAKLAEGKGAGYARWAQGFNLKQMAATLNFLTEHKLLDYGTLCKKTDEVTARFHELSGQIKAADARMAELNTLRKHIINYAKTREVYAAYRKAGYSKKFLAEHEADILLHKAAKKAFDEMGIGKLPTVKGIQTEYARLLAEKKALYPEYSQVRQEMKDLQMAKANVARLLGYEEKEKEKEKMQENDKEKETKRRTDHSLL